MHARLVRLTSIRGRLVLWYVGVLAVLLAALGIFQTVTLNSYVRSATAAGLRHSAYQELAVLGPCYIRSSAGLHRNARTLARLLAGHDTAVAIVTPSGKALAKQALGPPGATEPMRVSRSTVQQLISAARSSPPSGSTIDVPGCPKPRAVTRDHHHDRSRSNFFPGPWSLGSSGGLLLVAIPLGPPGKVVGYAILGRSLASANATATRLLAVFVVGALIALMLAALVALPIINGALSPLRRIALTAGEIAAGDLEQRANLARSSDEIGRLGEAFDAMVDRLQAAISATTASEERMRRFLADASHELRTPVTVLRGSSQVLLRQANGERTELKEALREMHEESVRLARLVDDLLTLSRLDEGQQSVSQPVEVRSFLREFLDRYSSVWPGRDIALQGDTLDGTTVAADPEALRRVLTNLIDNAARYSRAGGAISVSGEPDGDAVTIAVGDEGPGLSPEDARHVFDRFYRANKSRSRGSGGTGLGLAIVRGLIEQSGGTIDIDTAPDRGTVVRFTLPRRSPLQEP